jgi:hypothetical protein
MLYKAFISYSHAEDGGRAAALQAALHKIARPWYKLRALRVFRDETNLSASPHLWPDIEAALADCEWFILMASPRCAASKWVARELQWWCGNRKVDHILIVRTAGDIVWDEATLPGDFDWRRTTALPPVLSGRFEREPLHIDLSWVTTDVLSPRNPRFRGDALRIAARLHGKSPDEMEGEDIRVHRRNVIWAWTAGTLVTTAAVTAGYQAVMARRAQASAEVARDAEREARTIADEQRNRAEKALAETERELLRAQSAELRGILQRLDGMIARAGGPAAADAASALGRERTEVMDRLSALTKLHEKKLGEQMGFRGDFDWLLKWEGHAGGVKWLGSGGLWIDPGTDLAFAARDVISRRYAFVLSPDELEAVLSAVGLRGPEAEAALKKSLLLQRITLSPADVARLVPEVAESWWLQLAKRYPVLSLPQTPGPVHTALLSLAYNVGMGAQVWRQLAPAIEQQNWKRLADAIESLPDSLPSMSRFEALKRRRREEASLIRTAVQ